MTEVWRYSLLAVLITDSSYSHTYMSRRYRVLLTDVSSVQVFNERCRIHYTPPKVKWSPASWKELFHSRFKSRLELKLWTAAESSLQAVHHPDISDLFPDTQIYSSVITVLIYHHCKTVARVLLPRQNYCTKKEFFKNWVKCLSEFEIICWP